MNWQSTPEIRWVKVDDLVQAMFGNGAKLQQKWEDKDVVLSVVYTDDNKQVNFYSFEWRDVPTVKVPNEPTN